LRAGGAKVGSGAATPRRQHPEQPFLGLGLDLPDPFPTQTEVAADLGQRLGRLSVESEPQGKDDL